MRQNARMATSRVRTANYSTEARERLGEAALKAREALGFSRPQLIAAAANIGVTLNKKSLELVEKGQPGVGQSFLFALGRFLPNWTEDTAKAILEGEPPPTTGPVEVVTSPVRHEWSAAERQKMRDMPWTEVREMYELFLEKSRYLAEVWMREVIRVKAEAEELARAATEGESLSKRDSR